MNYQTEHDCLCWGGVNTRKLAEEYGTPLYVMDEMMIRQAAADHTEAIKNYFGGNGRAVFASKAFCCKEIYRLLKEEEFGADVVSGGELYTAVAAGMDASKLVFHGNNKTKEELSMAIRYGVGLIVVDNFYELERLNRLAGEEGVTQQILLRIKPGVEAHTHAFIKTGQIDSKFGLALETGEAMEAVKAALAASNLDLQGVHCHIGSQIFDTEPFGLAAKVMVEFMSDVREETGETLPILILGGGFGISFLPTDDPKPVAEYYATIRKAMEESCNEVAFPMPFLMTEPGRSIVGPAGITLYTIGNVKEIPGVRTYVSVDGGMTDNPRYALYQADYTATVANRMKKAKTEKVTIAGKCCESGDLLQEHMDLQPCTPGDLLAVFATGAYNYSMSSNYNRIPRPAVVFCKEGKSRVVVERETYGDLMRNDY